MTPARIGFAFLLNVIVIPGAGQLTLKFKKRGAFWIAVSLMVLAVFFVDFAQIVAQKMQQLSKFTIDPSEATTLARSLSENIMLENAGMLMNYLYALLACYLGSLLDLAYLVYADLRAKNAK